MTTLKKATKRRAASSVPKDSWQAFAYFVGKCATGFGRELMEQGKTEKAARNAVIGCFLAMAAGEACRIARGEGREPDRRKWRKATNDAFQRAVVRTKNATEREKDRP
jgi:hypothetical protein